MDSFYTYCHQAGPSLCAFHASSPLAIRTRLSTLLVQIKIHPVIAPVSDLNSRPEIITFSKVRRMIASALYRPLVIFPDLAESLAALESGDGRPFLDLSSQGQNEMPMCDSGTRNPEPTPNIPEVEGSADASRAIQCSDQAPFEGGVKGFQAYLGECQGASRAAGATMAGMRLGCIEVMLSLRSHSTYSIYSCLLTFSVGYQSQMAIQRSFWIKHIDPATVDRQQRRQHHTAEKRTPDSRAFSWLCSLAAKLVRREFSIPRL